MSVSVSSMDREEVDTKWEADWESTSNVQWKGNENLKYSDGIGNNNF